MAIGTSSCFRMQARSLLWSDSGRPWPSHTVTHFAELPQGHPSRRRLLRARAASGQAASPPSSVMNCRRFIRSPRRPAQRPLTRSPRWRGRATTTTLAARTYILNASRSADGLGMRRIGLWRGRTPPSRGAQSPPVASRAAALRHLYIHREPNRRPRLRGGPPLLVEPTLKV